jgi:hypothetical protein
MPLTDTPRMPAISDPKYHGVSRKVGMLLQLDYGNKELAFHLKG